MVVHSSFSTRASSCSAIVPACSAIVSSFSAIASSSKYQVIFKEDVIAEVDREAARVHEEAKRTANEYNVRGDLNAGTNIASFLRVANVMASHGAI